jgi:predicted TIM-barrel fold metal-dependent hydrolase
MDRRQFLTTSAAALAAGSTSAEAAPLNIPIIDTHIHLFDISRPQGVPWPPKDDKVLYKTALPARFREVSKGLNVVGAIELECSPWLEDNQWVLDVMAKDDIMVGMIGDLDPDHAEFPKHLERFRKNPLYLGIRYGNIWDRDFHKKSNDAKWLDGIKRLADANLTLDSANPTAELIADLLRLKDRVPNLRMVLDHLPRLAVTKAIEKDLRDIAKRPDVYVKVSGVLRDEGNRVPKDTAFYKPRLDLLFDIFGEDRVVYGSDWPHSDRWGQYPEGLKVVREYFEAKGQAVAEKYFWRNSVKAYRWIHRAKNQPKA